MTAERIEDRKDEGECFVGLSAHVAELRRFVAEGARHELPVLLIGERGLRQEQIARAVHHLSARWGQPFIAVNAQSLPSDELDRLLFGSRGVLVVGWSGTVYLNELVRLPSLLQQRLAIYLEEQRWRTDHGAGPRLVLSTDTASCALTAENRVAFGLVELLRPHRFALQPLRERREDIVPLAHHLAARIARHHRRDVPEFTPGALSILSQYHWEGNIDELEAVLESLITHLPPPQIDEVTLPEQIRYLTLRSLPASGIQLESVVEGFERKMIAAALEQTRGNQTRAARLLGLRVQTLNAKLKRLGVRVVASEEGRE